MSARLRLALLKGILIAVAGYAAGLAFLTTDVLTPGQVVLGGIALIGLMPGLILLWGWRALMGSEGVIGVEGAVVIIAISVVVWTAILHKWPRRAAA